MKSDEAKEGNRRVILGKKERRVSVVREKGWGMGEKGYAASPV